MRPFRRSVREVDVEVSYAGVRGSRIEDAPYQHPDTATDAKRLEAQRAGIAEAPITDFEITETRPGRVAFTDRATGVQYRRVEEFNPLSGDTLSLQGISCYVVDGANVMHLLRRRGAGNVPSRIDQIGNVRGVEVRT